VDLCGTLYYLFSDHTKSPAIEGVGQLFPLEETHGKNTYTQDKKVDPSLD
jgi:hypothetical protein